MSNIISIRSGNYDTMLAYTKSGTFGIILTLAHLRYYSLCKKKNSLLSLNLNIGPVFFSNKSWMKIKIFVAYFSNC